jgi:hypothetical protein
MTDSHYEHSRLAFPTPAPAPVASPRGWRWWLRFLVECGTEALIASLLAMAVLLTGCPRAADSGDALLDATRGVDIRPPGDTIDDLAPRDTGARADAAFDALDAAPDAAPDVTPDAAPDTAYPPCWTGDAAGLDGSGPMLEALAMTLAMAEGARADFEARALDAASPCFSSPVWLTPPAVPAGTCVTDPPGTWDNPAWQALRFGFAPGERHRYSYEFDTVGCGPRFATFTARALGDLDGDGQYSTFEMVGRVDDALHVHLIPGRIVRELE